MIGKVETAPQSSHLAWVSKTAGDTLRGIKKQECTIDIAPEKDGKRPLEILDEFRSTLFLIGAAAKKEAPRQREAAMVSRIVEHTLTSVTNHNIAKIGAYQGTLEVLSALGSSLTPGVIPAAAAQCLSGKELTMWCGKDELDIKGKLEEAKNTWMYGYGTMAIREIAVETGCQEAREIAGQDPNYGKSALTALSKLPLKKRK